MAGRVVSGGIGGGVGYNPYAQPKPPYNPNPAFTQNLPGPPPTPQQNYQNQANTTTESTAQQLLSNANNPRSATIGGVNVQSGPNLNILRQMMAITGAGKAGATQPQVAAPVAPARVAAPTPAGAAGPSVAFSRAKDASGRVGNAALSALRDEFSSRGMGGSSMEGGAVADVVKDTARYQSEAEAQAAQADAERAWEAQTLGYEGEMGQRGQEIDLLGTGYGGQITQRGQTLGAQAQQQQSLNALLQAFGSLY